MKKVVISLIMFSLLLFPLVLNAETDDESIEDTYEETESSSLSESEEETELANDEEEDQLDQQTNQETEENGETPLEEESEKEEGNESSSEDDLSEEDEDTSNNESSSSETTDENSDEFSEGENSSEEHLNSDDEEEVKQSEKDSESELEEVQESNSEETEEEETEEQVRSMSEMTTTQSSPPYELGDRAPEIAEFKAKLNAIGFSGILETEYFGEYTRSKVKAFQANYGLAVTGVMNQTSLNKLDEVYHSPFQVGNSHAEISDLKVQLNSMGFGGIQVTDYYGNFTAQRVEEFQSFIGIKSNGIADSYTRELLQNFVAEGYGVGDRHNTISVMKRKLNALGFNGIKVTDYYGSYTKKRVEDFQAYYGLNQTGQANQDTLDQLDQVYYSPLQVGNRSGEVSDIKRKLNRVGFNGILVTDYFGDFTEKKVKDFQSYYGLKNHGIVDSVTLNKLNEVYNSPYQLGEAHENLSELKTSLNRLGYGTILVSDYFGEFTEKRVKVFQADHNLAPSGIIDQKTESTINNLMNTVFQEGKRHKGVVELKEKLNKLSFGKILETTYFGSYTTQQVKNFQKYYGLKVTGVVNQSTWDKIDEVHDSPLQEGERNSQIVEIKKMLNAIDYGTILETKYFGSFTTDRVKDFQRDHGLHVHGIVDDKTYNLIEKKYKSDKVTEYNISFDRFVEIQLKEGSPKYDGAGNIPADEANVRYYLNPSNFAKNSPEYYQFMLLDSTTDITVSEIDSKFLQNKGTLSNTGAAFKTAGKTHNLNELYLMVHALHETGNGTSTLAKGVGVDQNGNIQRDSKGNIIRDINHKNVDYVVYNMYGYGAHDESPLVGGVNYAFENKWFSPESAIIGGAKDISNSYISQGQNTLYKMKWDPEYAAQNDKRGKQYATHIMWPEIQAKHIYNVLGETLNSVAVRFDIPKFINQPKKDDSKPDAPKPPMDLEEFPKDIIGTVTDNLNFREGPSTNYDRITTIPNGSEIDIIGEHESGWLNIQYNGTKGWVSGDYVDIKNLYYVNGSNVQYRSSPAGEVKGSLSDELVALSLDSNYSIVSKNAPLNGTTYTWYRISINGQNYWMAKNFLEKVN
ncbi:peptidoglycan-binding protein [Piscibacillus halophilus]|uniref:peptidoglycan-binding protein n=1 Tax=Piscibacillus halophilus TaxID=571933 RepID=UPI0015A66E07|nr:peptidoglycan-binding protein [Piscibacillus halophilus]